MMWCSFALIVTYIAFFIAMLIAGLRFSADIRIEDEIDDNAN